MTITNAEQIFADLLASTEVRKVDYKRDQYLLDNEISKSRFIKDILCITNAPGDDGYILLGVETEQGKPKEVVGISHHHDSSDLEAIVNGVIDAPIQFEYYPLKYQGHDCALLHIPRSKAKPHWPKRNYGKLERRIIYTRRSSGNREASTQEIREMSIETIQLSDIAQRKARTTGHVVDELADIDISGRKTAMYRMLKYIAPKILFKKYYPVIETYTDTSEQIFALVSYPREKMEFEFAIFMYPWAVKSDDIFRSRTRVRSLVGRGDWYSRSIKITKPIRERIKKCFILHICYKNIYTKPLERKLYLYEENYRFANEWNELWGKVMKWETDIPIKYEYDAVKKFKISYQKKAQYEFFLPNISSKVELQDRLGKLVAWTGINII